MISTDIIIVSYRDKELLQRCIASIKEHCTEYNLIIEDNNVVNRGFTQAINSGIGKGTAEFIWLINSDAVVLHGAQQGLLYRFTQGPQVGIVGSMQLDYTDRDWISCGGVVCGDGSPFPAGRHRGGRLSMGHWQIPEKQTWCNFASVMLRREMVSKIGPLDTSMFLIYSDSDYCYYARTRGYTCWYEPSSRVCHRLGASKTVTDWHKKDMEAFMKKWGITVADGKFQISEKFHKLDIFP